MKANEIIKEATDTKAVMASIAQYEAEIVKAREASNKQIAAIEAKKAQAMKILQVAMSAPQPGVGTQTGTAKPAAPAAAAPAAAAPAAAPVKPGAAPVKPGAAPVVKTA